MPKPRLRKLTGDRPATGAELDAQHAADRDAADLERAAMISQATDLVANKEVDNHAAKD